MGNRILLLITLLSVFCAFPAKSRVLSDQAKISILTCGPNEEVYALYGHTAIRVNDPVHKIDLAFNYGVFSFGAPHFIYRFAKGETDYLLYPFPFKSFLQEYQEEHRSIYEQDLDLTQKEKQQMFDFLVWNAKEENREYRYNFFFDNCASRVRDVVEKQVDGKMIFPETSNHPQTFRQLVKIYHQRNRWLNFGIDLVVCSPADRIASPYEEMFLPDYLMEYFSKAQIKTGAETRPLVSGTRTLYQAPPVKQKTFSLTDPLVVFLLLAALVIFLSVRDFRRKKIAMAIDYVVYGVTGLMGTILLWFVLFSEHPAMSPNYNLIWALPLNLLFAIIWMVKKWRPVTRWYHVFMSEWMFLFLIFSQLLPQWFHPVFYLFALMVISRSLLNTLMIFREKSSAKKR